MLPPLLPLRLWPGLSDRVNVATEGQAGPCTSLDWCPSVLRLEVLKWTQLSRLTRYPGVEWTQRVLTPTLGGRQPGDRHNMSQYVYHTLLLHNQHNLAHLYLPFVHQRNEVHLFGSCYINPCRALILCQIVCVCMSDSDSLDGFPCFWPCLFSSCSCPGYSSFWPSLRCSLSVLVCLISSRPGGASSVRIIDLWDYFLDLLDTVY